MNVNVSITISEEQLKVFSDLLQEVKRLRKEMKQ